MDKTNLLYDVNSRDSKAASEKVCETIYNANVTRTFVVFSLSDDGTSASL